MPLATIKELREFFEEGTYGRKCTVGELKSLSPEDRKELRELLGKNNS